MKKLLSFLLVLSFSIQYCSPISFAYITLQEERKEMPAYNTQSQAGAQSTVESKNLLSALSVERPEYRPPNASVTQITPAFKTSASFVLQESDPNGYIQLNIDKDQDATITIGSSTSSIYRGIFDTDKSTVTIAISDSIKWVFGVSQQQLTYYEIKSSGVGWGSSTKYEFTDGHLAATSHWYKGIGYSSYSRTSYTFVEIDGKRRLQSVVSEYNYSSTFIGMSSRNSGKSTVYNEYDSAARLIATINKSSYQAASGEVQYSASYVLYDYDSHATMTASASGLNLSQAGSIRAAEDFAKVDYYATSKSVNYFKDNTFKWDKWIRSIYAAKNTDGTFSPKSVTDAEGCSIVVNQPDVLSSETDDIRIRSSQMVNGYSVYYGQGYNYSEGKLNYLSFGLVFTKSGVTNGSWSQKTVVVDYPRESKVTLDGVTYEIQRTNGVISLIAESHILESARIEALTQINAAINTTSDEISTLRVTLENAQRALNNETAAFVSDINSKVTALNALKNSLLLLSNQAGVSTQTKNDIDTFLNYLSNYLAGTYEYAKSDYIQTLGTARLGDIQAALASKEEFLIRLNDHKTAVENVATLADLNSLKIPVYTSLEQASNTALVSMPDLTPFKTTIQTLSQRAQAEISAANLNAAKEIAASQTDAEIARISADATAQRTALQNAQTALLTELTAFSVDTAARVTELNSLKDALVSLKNQAGVSANTKVEIEAFVATLQAFLANGGAFELAKNDYAAKLVANRLTDLSNLVKAKEEYLAKLQTYKASIQNATSLEALDALRAVPPAYVTPTTFVPNILSSPVPLLEVKKTDAKTLATLAQSEIDASREPGPLSQYYIPLSAAEGGQDVNVIDWVPQSFGTNYKVYRKEFGATDWTMIFESPGAARYVDKNIDSSKSYIYEVRFENRINNYTYAAIAQSYASPNYNHSLRPANVLVLINTNDYGYVDISEEIPGYTTANGKLNPITESQLLAFLGLPPDALNDGHDATWHILKDTSGKISVPLGVYYAFRRGIPKKNILFLNNIPTEERVDIGASNFQNYVINPIKQYMDQNGLTSSITSIVSTYHFPLTAPGAVSWESLLSFNLYLAYGGNALNISSVEDNGRPFSRMMGDGGYMTTRIDAADIQNARRLIDDAIWSEENYHFDDAQWRAQSDLMAYIDWQGFNEGVNQWHLKAADLINQSGLFGLQGDNWDKTADIWDPTFIQKYDGDGNGKVDNTFLFEGWYHYWNYQNKLDWARGSIGWSFDSASADSFRVWNPNADNVYGYSWGAGIINRGAAASLGSVYEPKITGLTRPDEFMNYILKGYTFAEAAYLGSPQKFTAWQLAFDGDPLYTPFKPVSTYGKKEPIMEDGVQTGYRIYNQNDVLNPNFWEPRGGYRDYDMSGNLVAEKLVNGTLIQHLDDGSVAYLKLGALSTQLQYITFDSQGNKTKFKEFTFSISNFTAKFMILDGHLFIYVYDNVTRKTDVYDDNGIFIKTI